MCSDKLDRAGLDRWITGNYGEDQFSKYDREEEEREEPMGYTPGPWHVSKSGQYVRYHLRHSDIENNVAYNLADCDMGCPPNEARANAQLIAAAPELLEALKSTLRNAIGHACEARGIRNEEEAETWPWVQVARAAIAKAEGT